MIIGGAPPPPLSFQSKKPKLQTEKTAYILTYSAQWSKRWKLIISQFLILQLQDKIYIISIGYKVKTVKIYALKCPVLFCSFACFGRFWPFFTILTLFSQENFLKWIRGKTPLTWHDPPTISRRFGQRFGLPPIPVAQLFRDKVPEN